MGGDGLTVFEHNQGRDAAHAEIRRRFGRIVNVHFDDFQFVAQFFGNFFQNGAELAARRTPFRVKVHQYGNGGVLDFRFKFVVIDDFHRFCPFCFFDALFISAFFPRVNSPMRHSTNDVMSATFGASVHSRKQRIFFVG